jgi:hypothetical protein
MTDHRDVVHERLMADLVGPAGPMDEVITERPSDRYLSGILFPLRSELPPEEDERLEGGGDGEDNDGEDLALPPSVRPSTAGLSFAVVGDAPSIDIEISCAEYRFIEGGAAPRAASGAVEPVPQGVVDGQPSGTAHGVHAWKRAPRLVEVSGVRVTDAMRALPLDDHGLPTCELVFRSTRSGALWLVTVVLVNRRVVTKGSPREAAEENSLFQVRLAVQPGAATKIAARPSRVSALDEDGRSAALLYRDAREYAVGHVCAATWTLSGGEPVEVRSTWIPAASVPAVSSRGGKHFRELIKTVDGDCFKADVLERDDTDLPAVLRVLPDAYERWLDELREQLPTLTPDEQEQGRRHLEDGCGACLSSIRAGIDLLARDPDAARAFRLANRAMNLQYRWRNEEALVWRPFQLGFLLMTVASAADAKNEERELMDLLWFPTGGGKTEAYLALVAFVLFARRFRYPGAPQKGAGTAVIMRYTLRLLTTQQFQRAASLVLACDHLRRSDSDVRSRCGNVPFSIGLWVGDEAVANKRTDAFTALDQGQKNSPDQLSDCPFCKRQLKWGRGPKGSYVQVRCPSEECPLHGDDLPVWTVDEDVYERLPALLIGTVDKFAQMPNKAEIGGLFGLGTEHDSPDLIIQDELHLISGPLGTLAGLYESSIDLLCSAKGRRPKIIGSTATIRRAADQVKALFDRDVRLFPPPGLSVADSCFAVRDDETPARRYFAVTAAGRSAKFTLQATAASILQSAPALRDGSAIVDAYWTLVTYFNSLRELGGALILMRDDVPKSIGQFAARHGEGAREVQNVKQLTSNLTQAQLRETLADLDCAVGSDMAIDAVLATNMISVGLDIARLGVMVVNGQPKSIAEYIQATSRVGRKDWPGLVVAVYNHNKARDRSRFESFESWHQTLYREVEATSVTPFSPRARDRGLRACLVSLARHAVPALRRNPVLGDSDDEVKHLAALIGDRAERIDPEEAVRTREDLQDFVEDWAARNALREYSWYGKRNREALTIRAEKAAEMRAQRREVGDMWVIPSTMRNVEPGTPVKLVKALRAERTEDRE